MKLCEKSAKHGPAVRGYRSCAVCIRKEAARNNVAPWCDANGEPLSYLPGDKDVTRGCLACAGVTLQRCSVCSDIIEADLRAQLATACRERDEARLLLARMLAQQPTSKADGEDGRMLAVPITLREANAFIYRWHRHHGPSRGCIAVLGCATEDDPRICGVAVVGRPVARNLQDGWTAEVTRVASDGTKNACSFLYAAAWRAARALGYRRLVTYTLPAEAGASLRGAGWRCLGEAGGGSWHRKDRPRVDTHPTQVKLRWETGMRRNGLLSRMLAQQTPSETHAPPAGGDAAASVTTSGVPAEPLAQRVAAADLEAALDKARGQVGLPREIWGGARPRSGDLPRPKALALVPNRVEPKPTLSPGDGDEDGGHALRATIEGAIRRRLGYDE